MAIQCLDLDSISEDHYNLIAIHSSLPSYRLAYLLNQNLQIQLSREKEDVVFHYKDFDALYPKYQYKNHTHYQTFDLIANYYSHHLDPPKKQSNELFGNNPPLVIKKVFMPELKKAEYLLKITTESTNFLISDLVKNITRITQIITAYQVDCSKLKFKNYLIFE